MKATPKQDAFPGCLFAAIALVALAGIFACLVSYMPGSEKSSLGNRSPVGTQKLAGGLFETPRDERPAVSSQYLSPREGVLLANSPSQSPNGCGGFCSHPQPGTLRERCDLIEVHHFYDDLARLVFDQLLFYDWSQDEERYQLRDWRMLKQQDQLPRLDHERRMWVCHWFDGNALRRVEAESVRETWAQYDPEVTEREFLPKENRRELRKR